MNLSEEVLLEVLQEYTEKKRVCDEYQSGKQDTEKSIKDMLDEKSMKKQLVDKLYGVVKFITKNDISLEEAKSILEKLYNIG